MDEKFIMIIVKLVLIVIIILMWIFLNVYLNLKDKRETREWEGRVNAIFNDENARDEVG